MKITGIESNLEIIEELGKRIKRLRINIGLTQLELANKAGLSLRTIANIENGKDANFSAILSILRAENILGNIDLLIMEETIRPSDYLKLKKPRQRVVKKKNIKNTDWKWR